MSAPPRRSPGRARPPGTDQQASGLHPRSVVPLPSARERRRAFGPPDRNFASSLASSAWRSCRRRPEFGDSDRWVELIFVQPLDDALVIPLILRGLGIPDTTVVAVEHRTQRI